MSNLRIYFLVKQMTSPTCTVRPRSHRQYAAEEKQGYIYVDKIIRPMEKVGMTLATNGFSNPSASDFGIIIIFAIRATNITAERSPKISLYKVPYCNTRLPAAAKASINPDTGIGIFAIIASIPLTAF